MKVLMVFVLGCFLSVASPRARAQLSKPAVLILLCAVVALSFLSLRVSG
jgi:hypothetical protein